MVALYVEAPFIAPRPLVLGEVGVMISGATNGTLRTPPVLSCFFVDANGGTTLLSDTNCIPSSSCPFGGAISGATNWTLRDGSRCAGHISFLIHMIKRKVLGAISATSRVFSPSSVTKVNTTPHNSKYPAIRRVSAIIAILLLAVHQRYSSNRKKLSARKIHRPKIVR